jgi:hypothetical protein
MDVEGPFIIVAHFWRPRPDGTWERTLVRRHEVSGRPQLMQLYRVDKNHDFCLRCLSSAVERRSGLVETVIGTQVYGESWLCHACGVTWRIIN